MKSAILTRQPSTDQGTPGVLATDDEALTLHTIELPWRDNHPEFSCIPEGTYICKWHESPSKGWLYMITDVPDRSRILIHSANFAGDTTKDWTSELLGCIALGVGAGLLVNHTFRQQMAVIGSKVACSKFYTWGNQEDVSLTIKRSQA